MMSNNDKVEMALIEQLGQSGKFRKCHDFTEMQPLKPVKDNI